MKLSRLTLALMTAALISACTPEALTPPPVQPGQGNGEGENKPLPENVEEPVDADFVLQHLESKEYLSTEPEKPYSNSFSKKPYRPLRIEQRPWPVSRFEARDTRILPNMVGFGEEHADMTRAEYLAQTNRYGSRTDIGRQPATGHFYIKRVNGRLYFIDPFGYPNIQRGVASVRKGTDADNLKAFTERFGDDDQVWLKTTQKDLEMMGMHASGAFGTGSYEQVQEYSRTNPKHPLTMTPSYGFLNTFRTRNDHEWVNKDKNTAIAFVLLDDWEEFCDAYVQEIMEPYKDDMNVVGFFSDNEIDISGVLGRIRDSRNYQDPVYQKTAAYLRDKGVEGVTDIIPLNTPISSLSNDFLEYLCERYYGCIKKALEKNGIPKLYLGSRLHAYNKTNPYIVRPCGKYCDVISVNYYGSWTPAVTGMIAMWEREAPDTPFMITEFYTKGLDRNQFGYSVNSGAGLVVHTQLERAYAYQHFVLALLESKNCAGWHYFKYQDDSRENLVTGAPLEHKPANKGIFDMNYRPYPYMYKYVRQLNYNTYNLVDYFDNSTIQ